MSKEERTSAALEYFLGHNLDLKQSDDLVINLHFVLGNEREGVVRPDHIDLDSGASLRHAAVCNAVALVDLTEESVDLLQVLFGAVKAVDEDIDIGRFLDVRSHAPEAPQDLASCHNAVVPVIYLHNAIAGFMLRRMYRELNSENHGPLLKYCRIVRTPASIKSVSDRY